MAGAALFAPPSYMAVVAIDFGTACSGFAFSFLHLEGEPGIHLNKEWGNEQGYQTAKVPTSVLLTEEKEFYKFGYEAAEEYAQLEDEVHQVYFFERFKMLLHHNKDLNRNTKLAAKNGQEMLAIDIFSIALRYLKDKALAVISDNTTIEYTISDIQWVITVPAIWKAPAKQFMREAAYKAGLASSDNYEQIIIALEPEAASLYCRSLKMKDFSGQNGASSVKDTHARDGSHYLVADIGGGTLDVTAHEIMAENKIREIHHASGGDFGGMKVNSAFENFLDNLFGETFMHKFKVDHPNDWLETMNEFEIKKRATRVKEGTTRIRLSCNFMKAYECFYSDDNCRGAIARKYKSGEVKLSSSEYLCIQPSIMQELFEPAISGIINHLKSLLRKPVLKEVQLIFLVGGFAESPLLQTRVRNEFEDSYRILIPTEAKSAVLRGAVMFGRNPNVVEERILSETYGTSCYRSFWEDYDDPSKKEIIGGKTRCKDVFRVLASADELIHIGERRRISNFTPLRPDQTYVGFHFYSTANPDVRYVTDDEVSRLATVTVASPDTSKGTDRKVELNLYFGGTEIKATAVDIESKNAETVFFDFLSAN